MNPEIKAIYDKIKRGKLEGMPVNQMNQLAEELCKACKRAGECDNIFNCALLILMYEEDRVKNLTSNLKPN
jgi:hypothetical protein